MKENSTKQLLIIALKLLVICTIVAVIVAFVNFVTKDRITFNEKQNTALALTGIYGADFGGAAFEVSADASKGEFVLTNPEDNKIISCASADCTLTEDVTALYVLKDSEDKIISYCVAISPMGFKDKIDMLVAVNSDLTVKGVKIVSLSETSGIGTKVQENTFLEKFVGRKIFDKTSAEKKEATDEEKSTDIDNVDTISGATKSSKPVINAVKNSLKQVVSYINENGGAEQ